MQPISKLLVELGSANGMNRGASLPCSTRLSMQGSGLPGIHERLPVSWYEYRLVDAKFKAPVSPPPSMRTIDPPQGSVKRLCCE